MAAYEYKIGTTLLGMVTLASLGIPAPNYEYGNYANSVTLGDGSERGVGSPTTIWHWGFLQSDERAALRAYCANAKSAYVFIRTKIDDETYVNFYAILVWPAQEQRDAHRIIDFTIEFRNLEVV